MDLQYKFSILPLETFDEDLNPYILGILKWKISEYITPPNLRYFKKPEKSDYPLVLHNENYKYRDSTSKKEIIQVFLSNENIKSELKRIQSIKTTIWTGRGTLAKIIMGSFYWYDWRMFATKYGSNIYLKLEENVDNSENSMHHWMFVENSFSKSVKEKPNPNQPIREDEQLYCLFHSQIGEFDLVYTGEVTGVLADSDVKNMQDITELNQLKFVLTKLVQDNKSKDRLEYKKKTWWTQAYLAKVDDIFVGIKERQRDGHMLVRKDISHFKVDQLIQAQDWQKEKQLGHLNGFLDWLKTTMSGIDCPFTTGEIVFNKTDKSVTFKKHEGKTEHSFLTQELIDFSKKD